MLAVIIAFVHIFWLYISDGKGRDLKRAEDLSSPRIYISGFVFSEVYIWSSFSSYNMKGQET
jgi:hypothetical protein